MLSIISPSPPTVLQKNLRPISRVELNTNEESQVPDFQKISDGGKNSSSRISNVHMGSTWLVNARGSNCALSRLNQWKHTRHGDPSLPSFVFSAILRLRAQWVLWRFGLTGARKGPIWPNRFMPLQFRPLQTLCVGFHEDAISWPPRFSHHGLRSLSVWLCWAAQGGRILFAQKTVAQLFFEELAVWSHLGGYILPGKKVSQQDLFDLTDMGNRKREASLPQWGSSVSNGVRWCGLRDSSSHKWYSSTKKHHLKPKWRFKQCPAWERPMEIPWVVRWTSEKTLHNITF